MAKIASLSAFVNYANEQINKKNSEISTAFKSDLKKAIAHAGYPNKDEIGIVDEINDFDMSGTMGCVGSLIGGYMKSEDRKFAIPAVDKNTAPATISIEAIPEKTSEGTVLFGPSKGKPYKTTTKKHNEVTVSSNRDAFKVKE
jgi:hypothetical protein